METLTIRNCELSKILSALTYSMFDKVDNTLDISDTEYDEIYAQYNKYTDDFMSNPAMGWDVHTQHNLLLADGKAYIYGFDDIRKLESWLNTVETLITDKGLEDAKITGSDPTEVIKALRDFCAGEPYTDLVIEAYYAAL